MTEITPPPWRAYVEANGDYWIVDNWSPHDGNYDGFIVAQIPVGGRYSEGNANLIAEAPDLRTRLQRAEELLQEARLAVSWKARMDESPLDERLLQNIDAFLGERND